MIACNGLPGTRGRDRTGTILLSLVFETNASTNSATRALTEGKDRTFQGANVTISLFPDKKNNIIPC